MSPGGWGAAGRCWRPLPRVLPRLLGGSFLICLQLPLPGRPLVVLPQAAGRCPESPPPAPPPAFPQRASHCPLGFRSSVLPSRRPPRRLPTAGRPPPRPALCSLCSPPFCLPYTCEHHSQSFPYPCASTTSQKLREERNGVCLVYRHVSRAQTPEGSKQH